MAKNPFHKEMLERLSSPEELDRLVQILKPKGWVALILLVLIVILALAWSIFGSVSVDVSGRGILLTPGGLFEVRTPIAGVVTEITRALGEWITPDVVVAHVQDETLAANIRELRQQKEVLEITLKELKEQLIGDNNALEEVEGELVHLKNQLTALEALPQSIAIKSPTTGRLIQIYVAPGDYVDVGSSLLMATTPLEEGETLVCYAFLDVNDGQKILPGNLVRLYPEEVDTERYGYLEGKINYVSRFPLSDRSLQDIVRNPQLVDLLKNGHRVVTFAYILLEKQPQNFSGYAWSAPNGPPVYLRAGSVCDLAVEIARRPPIDFIFPRFITMPPPSGPNPDLYPQGNQLSPSIPNISAHEAS